MKPLTFALCFGASLLFTTACDTATEAVETVTEAVSDDFAWQTETFADKKIVRYQIPGWERLSLSQKQLVYHLTEAGLEGRDIMFEQNYRHNLEIRKVLDVILASDAVDTAGDDGKALMVYAKNVYFSSGIHHHYSNDKFKPGFDQAYLEGVMAKTSTKLSAEAMKAIFDPTFDAKKVSLDTDKDIVTGSAINFYGPNVTQAEAEAFFKAQISPDPKRPLSHGLNSRLVKVDGKIVEETYKVGGLYGPALENVVKHLKMAQTFAENKAQGDAIGLLADYYTTGSLKTWDDYNIAWSQATEGDIDYINGFVEVYNDPLGYTGSYENIVQIKDFDASERMAVIADNAQYFEDNSTIMDEHKKKNVTGVSYKVVAVAGEAGDASPSTPIGVNLPNADWIRKEYGSKSVSLGNIIEAYDNAGGSGFLQEFAHDEEEVARVKKHGKVADKMGTALHEVIGHASGQLNPGIGTPKETLKSYASTLEEARADLVGLYFIMDPKLVELGLLESIEAGKADYDSYIRNGLMTQLRRIEPGNVIEESHMRNRQLNAAYAFMRANEDAKEGEPAVIQQLIRDEKTYFEIHDYAAVRGYFGELLREIQRIKSEGDYEAGKDLVEDFGVQVDQVLHAEVLERSAALSSAPYGGFINPRLVAVKDADGNVTDVKVEYPDDFVEQHLEYAKVYGNL
ncbi:MAG: dihydrofolate reductase [Saprospiraceae bacterium]